MATRSLPLSSSPASSSSVSSSAPHEALLIDCDECVLQHSDACQDCVVTFLCGVDADRPVVVHLAEARAMRLLGEAGLAPPLRHVGRG